MSSIDKNGNVTDGAWKKSSIMYKYKSHVRDSSALLKSNKNVYSVQFNYFLGPTEPMIFAAVSGYHTFVYECLADGAMKLLQSYGDPDESERFYTLCWSRMKVFNAISSILVVAGLRGVIRIIDTTGMECVHSFIGHTAAVNEVKINPKDSYMLLTASRDHSIRLWCIKTRVCVAIFGGHGGHRDQVISVAFDSQGNRFVSGSMDHSLQVWDLTKTDIKRTIERAKEYGAGTGVLCFPTYKVHAADFVTRDVHANYIDCVLWFGDLILSTSCGEPRSIMCWHLNHSDDIDSQMLDSITIVHEFDAEKCDYWFMRFSLNYDRNMMAIGTIHGKIYLWNLDNPKPKDISQITLSNRLSNSVMRQPAFSRNGDVLICGDDNGAIWRWDKVQ